MTDYDKILAAAKAKVAEQGRDIPSKSVESVLLLDAIKDRQQDTRPLNQSHVEALAESIAVLGLIEPLVVDTKGRLLAGGHRLAAIKLLKSTNQDSYQKQFEGDRVPVRILPFDAEQDAELALQVEIAENEQRRDYTPNEVRAIAERLKTAGYVEVKGRPSKGQKALRPALEVIVGKSLRTLRRYLNDEPEESRTSDRLLPLRRALTTLEKWQQEKPKTKQERELAKQLPNVIRLIEDVLNS